MTRPRAALVALVTLLIASPVAAAAFRVEGQGPVRGGWPSNPQVHCTFVFDEDGLEQCSVYGDAIDANQLKARVLGEAWVFAYVDDARDAVELPLAAVECESTCAQRFFDGEARTSRFHLTVLAQGAPGTVVSVAVETSGPV